MKSHLWQTDTPEKTIKVGAIIGRWLRLSTKRKNVVIFLKGKMGSGKTTLANGIISGIGINGFAGSPSYTLVNQYAGKLNVNHIDLWRYASGADPNLLIEELSDYMNGAITIIEWGERIEKLIDKHIDINIAGEEKRTIELYVR